MWLELCENFIDVDTSTVLNKHLPIIVFSNIRPNLGAKFLWHLLLTMGNFDCEMELCSCGTYVEMFRKAELIGQGNLEHEIKKLTKKYILEQLRFFPVSSKRFDYFAISAFKVLQSSLLFNEMTCDEIPACLYTSIQEKEDKYENCEKLQHRKNMVTAIFNEMKRQPMINPSFPKKENILAATKDKPLKWDGTLKKIEEQSLKSFEEQTKCLALLNRAIDKYMNDITKITNNIGICGGPGCGKTFITVASLLYGMSKGLNVCSTALLANRANSLGGKHLHKLFCLSARGDSKSSFQNAEFALRKLLRNPYKTKFLRCLDILGLDEFLQNSAETLSCIDIIMRYIRGNNLPFGGLLIFTTMDQCQLRTIKGKPAILSTHVITNFRFLSLNQSVRAAKDEKWQRIQQITRMHSYYLRDHPEIIEEFRSLVSNNCTFVLTWDHPLINDLCYRMFGKHNAAKDALFSYLRKKEKELKSYEYILRNSVDSQVPLYSHMEWAEATEAVSNFLNTKVKEPRQLFFMKSCLYKFTENKEGFYNQSQLAYLLNLPSKTQVENFEPIEVFVGPVGVQSLDQNFKTEEELQRNGWKKIRIKVCSGRTITKENLKCERKQYPLNHYISGTVHAGMGATLLKLATEVSKRNKDKRLWLKGQVVVLLSRTATAKDTIFVTTDLIDTLDNLCEVLLKGTQYDDYIDHIIEVLSAGENLNYQPLTMEHFPFRISDINIPSDNSGFVYCLLSTQDKNSTYIGKTFNLQRRFTEHNLGYGAKQTENEKLRPWAIIGYVCGFRHIDSYMKEFENLWRQKQWNLRQNRTTNYVHNLLSEAENLINDFFSDADDIDLRLICLTKK